MAFSCGDISIFSAGGGSLVGLPRRRFNKACWREVELVSADGQSNNAVWQQLARRMIQQDQVARRC